MKKFNFQQPLEGEQELCLNVKNTCYKFTAVFGKSPELKVRTAGMSLTIIVMCIVFGYAVGGLSCCYFVRKSKNSGKILIFL